MFKVTQGKGVHITFANGYGISIQWGIGNYCGNRSFQDFSPHNYRDLEIKAGANGSTTAEIAIFDPDDVLCGEDLGLFVGDNVEGYCSPERVLEVMNAVASIQLPAEEIESDGYISDNPLFKNLDANDVADYKKWARDNYELGTLISEVWHPVVQDECAVMNDEALEKLQ